MYISWEFLIHFCAARVGRWCTGPTVVTAWSVDPNRQPTSSTLWLSPSRFLSTKTYKILNRALPLPLPLPHHHYRQSFSFHPPPRPLGRTNPARRSPVSPFSRPSSSSLERRNQTRGRIRSTHSFWFSPSLDDPLVSAGKERGERREEGERKGRGYSVRSVLSKLQFLFVFSFSIVGFDFFCFVFGF